MNSLDAISAAQPGQWVRPVVWRDLGVALTLVGEYLVIVPNLQGLSAFPQPFTRSLWIQEWEIVEPGVVLAEARRNIYETPL